MATITFEMRTDGALVVPATFKEKFAGVKAFIVAPHADSLVLMPQKQAQAKETLADYLRYLRTDDLLADTHRAKEESYALFEDQGLATLTLAVADVLIQQLAERRAHAPLEVEGKEPLTRGV